MHPVDWVPFFRLCLSITDFHPDTWNPAWSVSTILTGLLSFMVEKGPTLGSIETSDFTVSGGGRGAGGGQCGRSPQRVCAVGTATPRYRAFMSLPCQAGVRSGIISGCRRKVTALGDRTSACHEEHACGVLSTA